MQLQAILNAVEKQKGFVYRNARFAENRSAILVNIRPHGRSRPICSGCGRKGSGYDTLPQRQFEFVPLWGIAVLFLYSLHFREWPYAALRDYAARDSSSSNASPIFAASGAGGRTDFNSFLSIFPAK